MRKCNLPCNERLMQRLLDMLLAGVALLLLAPLLIPVVLILRLTGEGEVFFPPATRGARR